MFGTTCEDVLEYTEVLVYDRRTPYNAEGQLNDAYAHFLSKKRAYRLFKRSV